MYIVYLVTHVIMAICFFGIICSWFDLPNHRVERKKDRATIPVLKEDPAPKEPDLKKRILKDTPAGFKPNIKQKIMSKSPKFRYDMERLN
jgi:hypothetical protein